MPIKKKSKEEVLYDRYGPRGFTCDHCAYFREPQSCSLVIGPISKKAICILWFRKRLHPSGKWRKRR